MTYKARAYRSNDWWAIEITDGLPANVSGHTQCRRATNAERVARELIGDLLEIDPDAVELDMRVEAPTDLKVAKRALAEAEEAREHATAAEMDARRNVAVVATGSGLTMRETAMLMGVSHQRVKQLVDSSARFADDADERELPRIIPVVDKERIQR